MKLLYKKIAAVVVMCVVALVSVIFIGGKTSSEAEVTMEDTINETAYAVYNEPAMAVIVPNDLVKTTSGEVAEAPFEASTYLNKVVAYVDEFLPVRTEPTRESETIGKMYPGCVADVVERGEVWSKIRSGNVEGYIQNIYVCFDAEAEDMVILLGGEEELKTAVTIEEEQAALAEEARRKAEAEAAAAAAREAARKAAEEAAAREAAAKAEAAGAEQGEAQPVTEAATQAPVSPYYMELSDEDIYLLACIIDWEANAEVYEGKLAVANVVLNRVRSGIYPNTVSEVLYQRGQFGGVLDSSGQLSSRWQARLASGPRNQECYQAAIDAANGNNNVEGYLCFNGTRYCNLASFRHYVVIGNHCFYQR